MYKILAFGSAVIAKVGAFLTDGTSSALTADDFKSLLDTLSTQFNVTTLVGVIALVLGGSIGLYFMWWGARKLIKVVMKSATGKGVKGL